jgi:predicted O-linked N-acetylglucosamine transferase (SPINDLY family)
MLAALRLAPIQCVFWGHPQTTGLPTIDYFLSSELMESQQEICYSEELVLLPNISVCYEKPDLPILDKNRSDFNLNDESVVYLCCQSLFKYLPQYDVLIARIANNVPDALFVFLSSNCEHIDRQFTQRLDDSFKRMSLRLTDHFVMIPRLSFPNYLKLNMLSDIFLDSLGWSGGNTTLEAIACGLPVVTCPGSLMRSRHSYGILTMLGVTDTIASDLDEYVDIAVRLGLDQEYRKSLSAQMLASHHRVYGDQKCVRGLEQFYNSAIAKIVGGK